MHLANQIYRPSLALSQKQFFLVNWMHLSNLIVKYLAFACFKYAFPCLLVNHKFAKKKIVNI